MEVDAHSVVNSLALKLPFYTFSSVIIAQRCDAAYFFSSLQVSNYLFFSTIKEILALLGECATFDGTSTTALSTSTSSTMTSTLTSTTRLESTTTRATSLFQSLSTRVLNVQLFTYYFYFQTWPTAIGSTSHPTQSSPVFTTGSKLQSFSTTPLTSTTSFFYTSSTTSTTGSLPSTTTYRIATSPARAYRGGFITPAFSSIYPLHF